MVILGLRRLVSVKLPQQTVVDLEVVWRRDDPEAESRVEAVLADLQRSASGDRYELIDGGESVRRSFRLRTMGDGALKALAARLRTIEGITGYRLDPRDD